MVPRYETKEMSHIWSLENQYQSWMDVELAACKAWNEDGVIPDEDYKNIVEKSGFDVDSILKIEEETHHDMIAFVTDMANHVGPSGRFIHLGLTSSDVIDTASALRLRQSLNVILTQLESLMKAVMTRANEFRHTPAVARSHGVHAEPSTFGLKILNWYAQLERDHKRIQNAVEEISYGQMSGAVGQYAHLPPHIEERVCKYLDLKPDPISTQIIQRDRHSVVMYALASLGSAMERISVEIRHLQRTEVMEVTEPFGSKQKGSSAMPHKKNPILTERVSGMSRLLRSYVIAALENVAVWHERDISHSSVERIMWPDAFHLTHYMLKILEKVVSGMVAYPQNMQRNLDLTGGLVYSQRVLLELIERFGLRREDAYAAVQENAMKCWNKEGTFMELLKKDPRIAGKILPEELESMFSNDYYARFVDAIFARFGQ